MTAGHELAVKGARDYGTNVFESLFDPPCDAYKAGPDSSTSFYSKSVNLSSTPVHVDTKFQPTQEDAAYPLAFFKNVTNQIMFADGRSCDNMIRLFNTELSTAPNEIQSVRGSVKAQFPPFAGEQEWKDVYGLRFDSAFIENNYLPCESFRGYSGSPVEGKSERSEI
jgi:hypothetical protein